MVGNSDSEAAASFRIARHPGLDPFLDPTAIDLWTLLCRYLPATNSAPTKSFCRSARGAWARSTKPVTRAFVGVWLARAATVASDVSDAATRNWLMSRRWLLVAPTLLFLWIIAQIDN